VTTRIGNFPKVRIARTGLAACLTGALALGGCAGSEPAVSTGAPNALPAETIAISVGPCFGFCPVYDVSFTPAGVVTFDGKRHTEVLGERSRAGGKGAYRALAAALAPYRPADGTTARVECSAAISDTSSFTITWTASSGRQTVATHQRGCRSGPGQELDRVLEDLPSKLGIADWAKQVTRPGASRG